MRREISSYRKRTADLICVFLCGCCVVLFVENNLRSRSVGRQHDPNLLEEPADMVNGKSPTNQHHMKLFCFVKTHPANHNTKCRAVRDTWGKRCDKLLFLSTKDDPELPAINILPNLSPSVNDTRKFLTQKVFAGLHYIHGKFLKEYDWFHEADDDTYIIIDNARHFLSNKNPEKPLFFGHRFMKYAKQGFTSGGAAYVMSREALRRLVAYGGGKSVCNKSGAASDAHVSRCLEAVGAILGSTLDSLGRSRYHTFDIDYHMLGPYPDWYINFTNTARGHYVSYMADFPISFHYVDYRRMYIVDHLLHKTKVKGRTTPSIEYE